VDGEAYSAEGRFEIISKSDADSIAALKPSESAAIEEWVLYASMLQGRRIKDEARVVWQRIAKQRPDSQKIQDLAQ
jgi:hypothetical protein